MDLSYKHRPLACGESSATGGETSPCSLFPAPRELAIPLGFPTVNGDAAFPKGGKGNARALWSGLRWRVSRHKQTRVPSGTSVPGGISDLLKMLQDVSLTEFWKEARLAKPIEQHIKELVEIYPKNDGSVNTPSLYRVGMKHDTGNFSCLVKKYVK